jgi:hypothetical protein
MNKIQKFFKRIKEYIQNIPFKTYVTVFLEGTGLFANGIAIVAFFGANNTPKDSPNFYINNQEFLVWSLIAGIYTLGLSSAGIKRRWRRLLEEKGITEDIIERWDFFRGHMHWEMFVREFCFTLAVTLPLTYLYIRALDVAYTDGIASPWISLGETFLASVPVTFGIMISSAIFDKALSLYSGD